MITSEFYDRIKYHYQGIHSPGNDISFIHGFDTEALDNGEPFLFCIANGDYCKEGIVDFILSDKYYQWNFGTWNLKYDSGAVLYSMPEEQKEELWLKNELHYNGVRYDYIPHKFLKLSIGKNKWVKFWDICQYYQSSLERAASLYLGKHKDDIETKTFTIDYVKKHFKTILKYCIQDALLTEELGNYFLCKIAEFGIRSTALYSPASLSFRYFEDRSEIISVKRFWKQYPDFMKCVIDSYEGGKFEVTKRGKFTGYEYDVVSAYPYEIKNLINISYATLLETKKYQKDAIYGFIRCRIKVRDNVHLPCGLLIDNTRIYPIGNYYITITKGEYDYLMELGIDVTVERAFWLMIDNIEYPYAHVIDELFALKAKYKKVDKMLYSISKLMMNSYYGKMCQMIEDWRGDINCGVSWNPVYASVITANTRLKVTRIQNLMKKNCLAVHTDSVITSKPIPSELVTRVLGGFEQVTEAGNPGKGVIIACGCYQLGNASAFKGFVPRRIKEESGIEKYEDWFKILSECENLDKIPYSILRVESWVECCSKGHFDKVNLFQEMPKNIDFNKEIKRIWYKKLKARDFLKHLYSSEPRIIVNEKPKYW